MRKNKAMQEAQRIANKSGLAHVVYADRHLKGHYATMPIYGLEAWGDTIGPYIVATVTPENVKAAQRKE